MIFSNQLEDQFKKKLEEQLAREAILEKKQNALEQDYSGLKDIDDRYALISQKLKISIAIVDRIGSRHPGEEILKLRDLARDKAREAVRLIDDLISTNISEDQKELILKAPGYKEARDLLSQLLVKGGGAFFETKIEDKKKAKKIAKTITQAILKF